MQVKHIVIIGLGSIGRRHLRLVRALRPELKISVITSKTNLPPELSGLIDNSYPDLSVAPKSEFQAAIICSPSSAHLTQAADLMEYGVHLLIEKPISNKLDQLDEFKKLYERSRSLLTVGYVMRYRPDMKFFFDLLKTSKIGKLVQVDIVCRSYLPDWRADQDYRESVSAIKELGGGVLLEVSHELDYLIWMFGKSNVVSAELFRDELVDIDVEEKALLNIISENQTPIAVELNMACKQLQRYCSVTGEKGVYTCDFIAREVEVKLAGKLPLVKKFEFDYDWPFVRQLESFFDCIENDRKPLVSLDEAIEVVRLVNEAKQVNRRVI